MAHRIPLTSQTKTLEVLRKSSIILSPEREKNELECCIVEKIPYEDIKYNQDWTHYTEAVDSRAGEAA